MAFDGDKPDLVFGLVGTGTMGRGIAQVAALGGLSVLLYDNRQGAVTDAVAFIRRILASQVEKGRLTSAAADAAVSRLLPVSGPEGLAEADCIVEAVVERLDVKRELFQKLSGIARKDTILATNTSSLSVSAIAQDVAEPQRVAGLHFFNPVPLMKLVEVVAGARTEPWVMDALTKIAGRLGRQPVAVADMPGFLVNHAGRGYLPEASRILAQGIATAADIDRIMTEGAGFRMGPFELADLVGLDVSLPVMESIHRQFHGEPMYQPSAMLTARVAAGLLGRKSGAGFYEYRDGQKVTPPEPPVPIRRPNRVWVSRVDVRGHEATATLLSRLGAAIDRGDRPAPDSLIVVTPLGDDATAAAVGQGLDPARTVALDTLFDLGRRRSLMATPATSSEVKDAARGLFAADGVGVTLLRDSPGFVAQRMVAMIVNIGAAIAEQRIAAVGDIDEAVQLGLNYPLGPLALGDAVGPKRVLAILEAMHRLTGEPRYRPTGWLRRRAALGLSMKSPD
jgi:3-hydroxybutyryl-CoA dehydrogenase